MTLINGLPDVLRVDDPAGDGGGGGSDPITPAPQDGGTPGDGGGEPVADGGIAPSGAPEKYAAFNYRADFALNEADFTQLSEMARELNLDQEHAQKLYERLADNASMKAAPSEADAETQRAEAETRAKAIIAAHPVLGGAHQAESDYLVDGVFVKSKGGMEAKAKLESAGLLLNPEVRMFFLRLGERMAPDSTGGGGIPGGREMTMAEKLHPQAGTQ